MAFGLLREFRCTASGSAQFLRFKGASSIIFEPTDCLGSFDAPPRAPRSSCSHKQQAALFYEPSDCLGSFGAPPFDVQLNFKTLRLSQGFFSLTRRHGDAAKLIKYYQSPCNASCAQPAHSFAVHRRAAAPPCEINENH